MATNYRSWERMVFICIGKNTTVSTNNSEESYHYTTITRCNNEKLNFKFDENYRKEIRRTLTRSLII